MKILSTILLSIIISSAFGQTGGLKGHVTLDSTELTPGLRLEIFLKDRVNALAFTDESGTYIFENIKAGTYDLRISFVGYRDRIIRDISIVANEVKELEIDFPGPCIESVKKCPKGHTDNLIPIAYGLPGTKLMKEAEEGKVKLGGCIITHCDPKWYCKKHKIEF